MQRILVTLGQVLRRNILVLGLTILVCLSGLFIFVQPSYASLADKLSPEDKIERAYEYSEATGKMEEQRQDTYEQAVKDSESPATLEKAYERNVKAYEKENPQPNLIQKAEEVIEKVTSK